MWIVLLGDPKFGFEACGPFKDVASARSSVQDLELANRFADGNGWYEFKLEEPDHPAIGYDVNGSAAVAVGNLVEAWLFFGPFVNTDAAHAWVSAGDVEEGCVVMKMKSGPIEAAA
jgi:hypothetical protein